MKKIFLLSIFSLKENTFVFSQNIFVFNHFNHFSCPSDCNFHAKNIFLFNQKILLVNDFW